MKKDELRELARVGALAKLRAYEAELAIIFKAFPEVFASRTLPVLARPELRNGSAWPVVEAVKRKYTKSTPEDRAAKRGGYSKQVRKNRRQSAALLQLVVDAGKPLAGDAIAQASGVPIRWISPLVRRGYLKHTRKGYVRTAKEFVIDKRKSAASA